MKKVLRSNKGFSLVELIIVIAIMVALIGVMAPQFMKYVTKSRDAVVSESAQEVLSFVKSEYASGNLTGTGKIRVASDKDATIHVMVANSSSGCTLKYKDENGSTDFSAACGVDGSRKCKSTVGYVIEISSSADILSSKIEITVSEDSDGYQDFSAEYK